ncbi:HEAT repeat domain-containing protein [Streptomyces sp. NPDC058864]
MTGAGRAQGGTECAALRRALGELDAWLDADAGRGPRRWHRCDPLVEQLRTPAAAFLRPELERRLARYVEADDSFARDEIAHVLAGACGPDALPALLRAMVSDRNEDGDTLQSDVAELFLEWPGTALALTLEHVASDDPGTRRVGLWGLCSVDDFGREHLGLVADAASDPDPGVRAHVMRTLGTLFGLGDPSRAQAILITGTFDAAPEVRREAVGALHAWMLSRSAAPEARAALERLTADEDADVRDAAREGLAPPVARWP